MPDILHGFPPPATPPTLAVRPLLSDRQAATLAQQLRADLARDHALMRRLGNIGADTQHVARRIAATRASLADLEGE